MRKDVLNDRLRAAAKNGDAEGVRAAVERGGEVMGADADGWVAMHYAALNGMVECMEILVSEGADLEAMTTDGEETPLMMAAWGGEKAAVIWLLNAGADWRAKSLDGETAEDQARMSMNHECADELKARRVAEEESRDLEREVGRAESGKKGKGLGL